VSHLRFWSLDGPDESYSWPWPNSGSRSVHANYWDYDWRRANRGGGRYPEHELREAVEGYLDLLDAGDQ
jgi:hypothetical protein